ncbi:cob(I)yrinic acid a,c-diamide adenosyltransferase [Spiroplasma endosymbiont of Melieria omissa]
MEQCANLISEVKSIKHYFEQGQIAREGIDY